MDEIFYRDRLPYIDVDFQAEETKVRRLVENNDISALKEHFEKNQWGATSLNFCIACKEGFLEIVKILVENGANVDDKSLNCAISGKHTDVIEYLRKIND
jgi:hypothetical protein